MSLKHYLVTKTIVFLLVSGFIAPAYPADSDESDVYIPIDLNDCFQSLDRLLKPEDIEIMRIPVMADTGAGDGGRHRSVATQAG